jgi:hypothetical protein
LRRCPWKIEATTATALSPGSNINVDVHLTAASSALLASDPAAEKACIEPKAPDFTPQHFGRYVPKADDASDVHKIKTWINLAAEIRNYAQSARQISEQRQSVLKRLDRGTKLLQLSGDGILLGECRFNLGRTAISEAIEKRDA